VKTFTDNAERSWDVAINVAAVKRVRDLTGVDLLEIVDGTLIEKLIRDPILLCDIVYAVCKPQADERDPVVSDEEFGRAMAGDAIEHATTALLEDLVSFCPSPRDRKNLGQVLAATNRVMDRARDLVEQKLSSGELERMADEALAQPDVPHPVGAGSSSGTQPASSESIRAP
jgi:hypothetical protein